MTPVPAFAIVKVPINPGAKIMPSIGLITDIIYTTDGQPPQMGPTRAIPFLLEVETTGGRAFLEISQDAAVKLRAELGNSLQGSGFP
jgi:hypothetical protein